MVEVEVNALVSPREFAGFVESQRPRSQPGLVVVVGLAVGLALGAVKKSVLLGAAVGGGLILMTALAEYRRRSALAKSLAKVREGEMKFRFDDHGFRLDVNLSQKRWAWSLLDRYSEAAECFVIFTDASHLVFVPKRAFDPEQLATVRQLLATRIVAKAPVASNQRSKRLLLWTCMMLAALITWQLLQGAEPRRSSRSVPSASSRSGAQEFR